MPDVGAVLKPGDLKSSTTNAKARGFETDSRCSYECVGIDVESCLSAQRTSCSQSENSSLAEKIQGWPTREDQIATDLKVNKDVSGSSTGTTRGPTCCLNVQVGVTFAEIGEMASDRFMRFLNSPFHFGRVEGWLWCAHFSSPLA